MALKSFRQSHAVHQHPPEDSGVLCLRHEFRPSSFRLVCLADCSQKNSGQFTFTLKPKSCCIEINRKNAVHPIHFAQAGEAVEWAVHSCI